MRMRHALLGQLSSIALDHNGFAFEPCEPLLDFVDGLEPPGPQMHLTTACAAPVVRSLRSFRAGCRHAPAVVHVSAQTRAAS